MSTHPATLPERAPLRRPLSTGRRRLRADALFQGGTTAAAALVLVAVAAMAIFLVVEAFPALRHYGVASFLHADRWAPSEATDASSHPNPYGIAQFVYGTVVTSLIAMVLAVPVAVAVALCITDIAPPSVRAPLVYLVDLLAAIPSVVYGFWGIFALIPALRPIGTWLSEHMAAVPVVGVAFEGPFFGVSYLAAGVVLAIMTLPIVTAICREVFAVAPRAEKEAALALGATRWEMLRVSVLSPSRAGIAGAAILGLGRAIGETIAVTMLIGNNVLGITKSILGQGATMPSVIANEFTEATEPFHLRSLFVVALWLLVFALVVNVAGRMVVARTEHR
jgi:phosphate transport system permease protein